MSVAIAGSGISGLMLAAELKLLNPDIDIVITSNLRPGNSSIAGQRYRIRMGGSSRFQELHDWYAAHDDLSDATKQFFAIGRKQMMFWRSFDPAREGLSIPVLTSRDSPSWFGPQLGEVNKRGSGRGATVLKWLKDLNVALGVRFLDQTVGRVIIEGGAVSSLSVLDGSGIWSRLDAESYVLASGAPSGSMFLSTNVVNWDSLLPGLYAQGLGVDDESVFMLHMAARCDESGNPKNGCHETDMLADCDAFLRAAGDDGWEQDQEISQLLRTHRAHERMQDLCKRIISRGGLVKYQNSSRRILARVSHHYSHLRMRTTDGVRVTGLDNCFVAGDMAGLGHWLGVRPRLPGTALLGCMVSAAIIAHRLAQMSSRSRVRLAQLASTQRVEELTLTPVQKIRMREINTAGLFAFACAEQVGTQTWRATLEEQLPANNPWVMLSLRTAKTCSARLEASMPSA